MALQQDLLKGRERTNSGVSASGRGANGLLRSEILAKVFASGLALSTLLRKLPELMMLKHGGFEARRPRSISQTQLQWLLRGVTLNPL